MCLAVCVADEMEGEISYISACFAFFMYMLHLQYNADSVFFNPKMFHSELMGMMKNVTYLGETETNIKRSLKNPPVITLHIECYESLKTIKGVDNADQLGEPSQKIEDGRDDIILKTVHKEFEVKDFKDKSPPIEAL